MIPNLLAAELKRSFPENDIHFNRDFHQSVVDIFPILRRDKSMLREIVPELHIAARFRGDFFGLLAMYKQDPRYHQLLTEFNGMSKSSDYDGTSRKFLLFDVGVIEERIAKPLLSKR